MKTCKRKKSYPDWAKYKAIDSDGAILVYEDFPKSMVSKWDYLPRIDGTYPKSKYIKTKKNYKGNWYESLRKIED